MAKPVPVPVLNVLPPSSDNDSWSPASSPLPRRKRIWDGKKRRTRVQDEGDASDGDRVKDKRSEETKGRSHSPVGLQGEGLEEEEASNSASFLLSPSRCSSPGSRRSRWSLRSLLVKDSDCESCRLVRERSLEKKQHYDK